MASANLQGDLRNYLCAGCHQTLEDPVQLPACFHILCFSCEKNLEAGSDHNILCPQCGKENARPSVLQKISGVEQSHGTNIRCDVSPDEHDVAKWFCFDCAKNLCGSCRVSHIQGHNIYLLANPDTVSSKIWEHKGCGDTQAMDDASPGEETSSSTYSFSPQCLMCSQEDCQHMQLVRRMTDEQQDVVTCCNIVGHVDNELKYFCNTCWTSVCGDCSQKGTHKLHDCDDVSSLVKKSLLAFNENLQMMIRASRQDIEDVESTEERLRKHIKDTETDLNSRMLKIQEEAEDAFGKAIRDTELQGRSILTDYMDKLDSFEKFAMFLQKTGEVVNSLAVNEQQPDVAEYIRSFSQLKLAEELVSLVGVEYKKLRWPVERRLVLPEPKATITIPPTLARVGTEWKQLELSFSFKFDDDYSTPRSIVLIDSNTCLLSSKNKYGHCVVKYSYRNKAFNTEYKTEPGDYFLSQLPTGEIVASHKPYSNYAAYPPCQNSVRYFNFVPGKEGTLEVDIIREFEFPPLDIATTKDNNILLCVNADKKAPKSVSYLMLMSMRGKILVSTMEEGPDMISPNYVAVSEGGEICVSDTDGSSIILLDENLKIKERMKYDLPLSMNGPAVVEDIDLYKFQPHGVCYDSYGRIIVADPCNNCVVRLLRDPGSQKYKLEPLLTGSGEMEGFQQPTLVAMGKDSRLWVVCKEHVFVFDYCV